MLLPIDEQLHKLAMYQPLEKAIEALTLHKTPTDVKAIMGHTLLPQQFLVAEEVAANIILSEARKHWGRIPDSLHHSFDTQHIQIERLHAQLDNFFYSQQGKEQFLSYLRQHNSMTLSQLLQLLTQRTVTILPEIALKKMYLYPIGTKYMVHNIYQEHEAFWYELFIKKVYALLIHEPIADIAKVLQLVRHVEEALPLSYPHVDNLAEIYEQRLQQLISFVRRYNPPSASLKQLELYHIFLLARRKEANSEIISKKIKEIRTWDASDHMLAKTEKVALRYVLLLVHAERQEHGKVISNAHYLLHDECLNSYAIKIMLTYTDVLPTLPANENTLVKDYSANYMEQLYYYYMKALVKQKKYAEALTVIKSDPLASNIAIYRVVNNLADNEVLATTSIRLEPFHKKAQQKIIEHSQNLIEVLEATTYKGLARRLKLIVKQMMQNKNYFI